jgi:hypothetical protein
MRAHVLTGLRAADSHPAVHVTAAQPPQQPTGMFQEAESLLCCEAWPDAQQLLPLAEACLPCICDTKTPEGDALYYALNSSKVCAPCDADGAVGLCRQGGGACGLVMSHTRTHHPPVGACGLVMSHTRASTTRLTLPASPCLPLPSGAGVPARVCCASAGRLPQPLAQQHSLPARARTAGVWRAIQPRNRSS